MILRMARSRPQFGNVNLHGDVFRFVFAYIGANTLKPSGIGSSLGFCLFLCLSMP